jgi:hypothetical protein
VSVRFVPSANGPATATFNIFDNAPDSPQHISLSANAVTPSVTVAPGSLSLSFGNQSISSPSAEQKITLSNQGPGNLVVFGWSLIGANPNDFMVSSNTCNGSFVSPGSSCAIGIEFNPMDIGNRTATLSIGDNAAGSPQVISLSGTGLGAKVNPSSALAFGENGVGWPAATRAITLTNVGTATMNPLTVTVGGQNPSDFSATGCASPVMPGGACTITVGFAPPAIGNRFAWIQISGTGVVGLPQSVQLSGIGMLFRSVARGSVSTVNSYRSQDPAPPPLPARLGGPRPATAAASTPRPAVATHPTASSAKSGAILTSPSLAQATIPSIQELISRLIAAWLGLLSI